MIERDIALVTDLLARPAEDNCLEFKKDNSSPQVVGKLSSALSNAARIEGQETAYIMWGVEDGTMRIVGTKFDPASKTVGNQVFEFWLAQHLKPSINFSFRSAEMPEGRVVLLEIQAATTAPVEYEGVAYVRIGSATPRLSEFPDRF